MKTVLRLFSLSLVSLGILAACGGSSGSSGPPPINNPPPPTELVWDQGNWDQLNWQ